MSRRDAPQHELRELRDKALSFTQDGKHDRAAAAYLELGRLDPAGAGDWARRAADCYRRLGRLRDEIEALSAAAEAYQKNGLLVRAIAICKTILARDPKHTRTQQRLSAMHQPSIAPAKAEWPPGVWRLPVPPPRRPLPRRRPDAASEEVSAPAECPAVPADERPASAPNVPAASATGNPPPTLPQGHPPPRPPPRPPPVPERCPPVVPEHRPLPSVAQPPPASAKVTDVGPIASVESAGADSGRTISSEPAIVYSSSAISVEPALVDSGSIISIDPAVSLDSGPVISVASATPVALAHLPLYSLVPGSRRSDLSDEDGPGVYEVPLDEIEFLEELPHAEEASLGAGLDETREGAWPPVAAPDDSALERQKVLQVLPKTPLLSELSRESLELVIERATLVELGAGEMVCRQGEPALCLYVIVQGQVSVALEQPREVSLGTLKEGDFFGEISLVSGQARTATVRTLEPTELLAIKRETIAELIEREPAMLTVVLRFVRARLLKQLVARIPLFEPFAGEHADSFAPRLQLLEIESGSTLIRQGQKARGLFILLCGTAEATRSDAGGEQVLGELSVGHLCGEMSLLSGEPAVATVRATCKCLALLLPATDFREAIMVHPQLLELVSYLADERRAQNAAIVKGHERYVEAHLEVV